MKMFFIISFLFSIVLLSGCNKSKDDFSNNTGNIILPTSLQDAITYIVIPDESQ